MTFAGTEKGQYLADLFAGTGGVGRAAAGRYKTPSHIYDINKGVAYDLTDNKVLRRLERDALKGRLVAAMLATPCTSWSVARNRTNVIRSRFEPWGVRHPPKPISAKDSESLRLGNLTMRSTLRLIKLFTRLGIPWALENPFSSNMWWVPALRKYWESGKAQLIVVDQCAWGRPWRKRTRILISGCDAQDIAALERRHCSGHRVCSYSGKPHVQLTGSGPGGKPMTLHAQEFPQGLSSMLARILLGELLHRRATRTR